MSFSFWVMLVSVGSAISPVPGTYLSKEQCVAAAEQAAIAAPGAATGLGDRPAPAFICLPVGPSRD